MYQMLWTPLTTLQQARERIQTAIGVEFGTLPPYLYALYSIREGTNPIAQQLIRSVALQEMIHMCLMSNMLNALGGDPMISPQTYPGPLPGDIGPDRKQLKIRLYPFSEQAMAQAMAIEEPEDKPDFPIESVLALDEAAPEKEEPVTIGEFYCRLDKSLATLPESDWIAGRNQIADDQFFPGQLFAINNYPDAHRAIEMIVSEGEGTNTGTVHNPLDFQDDVAHYFRFGEIFYDRVLTKSDKPEGYQWGPTRLGVDWKGVYPAIADPGAHDFSREPPAAQAAQIACNKAFSSMVDALQRAVGGKTGALGEAVQAMFVLRMAAHHAFTVPLADATKVAGPAFIYLSGENGGSL